MKQLKSIFFTLMTMACMAVLTTSCNQTDLITEEFTETNITMLANKLADNPDFQKSITMHEQTGNDLMKFIEDNNINISEDDIDITSFVSSHTTSEDEFDLHKTNLLTSMPELNSVTEQTFEEAFSFALNSLGTQELSPRNCANQYNICIYQPYINYYYGSISYNSYIAAYYACIQQYYWCI